MKKQPETFEYLGKLFTPVIMPGKYNWDKLSRNMWGNDENLQRLDCINKNGYTHEDFYKAAKKAGCGKVDVFMLNGETVIPCNILRYYKQPSWYAKELMKRQYISQTREYLKHELKAVEKAMMEKLDKAKESGAIPEEWTKQGNHLLQKAIMDSFCKDMPYSALDKKTKKEFSNLHLFI